MFGWSLAKMWNLKHGTVFITSNPLVELYGGGSSSTCIVVFYLVLFGEMHRDAWVWCEVWRGAGQCRFACGGERQGGKQCVHLAWRGVVCFGAKARSKYLKANNAILRYSCLHCLASKTFSMIPSRGLAPPSYFICLMGRWFHALKLHRHPKQHFSSV